MSIIDKCIVYLIRIKFHRLYISFIKFFKKVCIRLLLCARIRDMIRNKRINKQCQKRRYDKCHDSLTATVIPVSSVVSATVTAVIASIAAIISIIIIIFVRSLIIHNSSVMVHYSQLSSIFTAASPRLIDI